MKAVEKYLLIFGLFLILFSFFGSNNTIELRAEEPRRAIVSMEMELSENYIVPKIHGWSYYNKPPVFNWVMVLFFKLFGSFDEWVVRFPALVAFLATAVVNFFIVKRFQTKEVALLSSLFFLSAADLLFYGTVNAGEIDLFFSFLVYLQVMAIFWFFEKKQYVWLFLISYLLAAAGTLTKGPPSIAFQGLTLLPWFIINRQWKVLFSWKHFLGIGAYLLVVGGYFYWYSMYDDAVGFIVRLYKEAAQRTGMEHTFWDTLAGIASFPFLLLKLLFPWSVLLIFLFRKDVLAILRSNSLLRFCGVFILFNIPLYWVSADHKSRYLYMFFPFFCIILSFFFLNVNSILEKWKGRIFQFFGGIMLVITLVFTVPPFISYTSAISFIFLKCAFLIVLGIAMVYVFRKYPDYKIYSFLLFLFIARIGFNFIYLPALAAKSNSLVYRSHVEQILAITGEEPVYWYDVPYTFNSDASIGPLTFKDVKLTSAGMLPYQIPYYLTKGNGHIMQFKTSFQANQYYLASKGVLEQKGKQVNVLYDFTENWLHKEMVLFKTNAEER